MTDNKPYNLRLHDITFPFTDEELVKRIDNIIRGDGWPRNDGSLKYPRLRSLIRDIVGEVFHALDEAAHEQGFTSVYDGTAVPAHTIYPSSVHGLSPRAHKNMLIVMTNELNAVKDIVPKQ